MHLQWSPHPSPCCYFKIQHPGTSQPCRQASHTSRRPGPVQPWTRNAAPRTKGTQFVLPETPQFLFLCTFEQVTGTYKHIKKNRLILAEHQEKRWSRSEFGSYYVQPVLPGFPDSTCFSSGKN